MELMRKKADVEEERNSEYCLHNEHGGKGSAMIPSETSLVETSARPSSSNPKRSTSSNQEYQLESTKAEMFEVREENERLKMTLTQIIKDYKSLQMYFSNVIVQQQAQAKITVEETPADDDDAEEIAVALSLGTSSSTGQKKEDKIKTMTGKDSEKFEEGLTLGLDCKFEGSSNSLNEPVLNLSPDNNSEDIKEEDTGMPWPPSKTLKSPRNGDDEASQQPQVKKARVSIRTRCDGPTMNDGCQWRKYGQKISKGNPCPRAYYRCTISPACPVRKQVQRCVEDMSILITTYEGTHNHLLPVAATAMASTTAAAASMLMSGPSASQPAIGLLASSSITTNSNANNFHSPSFSLSDNMRWKQFYLPNPSSSSTSSHPTITLDLTAPPSCSSQANLFSRFSSNFTTTPRYSSTSFNLSSSESNSLPTSWSNRYLNYGAQPYNKSSISMSLGRQSQAPFYRSYLQMATNPSAPAAPNHHPLSDTIAKAITLDPKFHSALTAAITSYVEARGGKNGGEGLGHSLKWGEHLDSLPASAAPLGINACATSYLNKSTGLNLNTQQGSLLLQSSLGFSINKSASTSPEDHNKGNIN